MNGRIALILLFALVALLGVLRPAAVAAARVFDDAATVAVTPIEASHALADEADASSAADDSGDEEPAVPAERLIVAFELRLVGSHRAAALLYEPPHREPSVPPIV